MARFGAWTRESIAPAQPVQRARRQDRRPYLIRCDGYQHLPLRLVAVDNAAQQVLQAAVLMCSRPLVSQADLYLEHVHNTMRIDELGEPLHWIADPNFGTLMTPRGDFR